MNQTERRKYLIGELLKEKPSYGKVEIPESESAQKRLLRSLFNLRAPSPVSRKFIQVQDEYLRAETEAKGVTDIADLKPVTGDLYLWQGDITTLRCDAIVNAANSALLGCFYPCHGCIDNAIHTFSGVRLRLECAEIMQKQGRGEATGTAKITSAYNLPCKYVLHTVGPIVDGAPTERDEALLASCYRSCLELADENGVQSLVFCCISTGEFHFPNDAAAKIAVDEVLRYKRETGSGIKIIFNVFKDIDRRIYEKLLGKINAS